MPHPSFTSCSLVVSVGSGPGSVIVLKAPADRQGRDVLNAAWSCLGSTTLPWCRSFEEVLQHAVLSVERALKHELT